MTDFDVESRLREALIEKYGNECSQCGLKKDLNICHIMGQANLEYDYYLNMVENTEQYMNYEYYIYSYYLEYFEAESEFLGLTCNSCEIISPQHPTYNDVIIILGNFWDENNVSELMIFMEIHPHTQPLISRLFRLMNFNQDSSNTDQNGSFYDKLGERFGR